MTTFTLVPANHPILHARAIDVPINNVDVQRVIRDMQETMRLMPGAIGLAAPQVGLSWRVFVTHVDGHELSIVNPRLIYMDPKSRTVTEGCLSYPGRTFRVRRSLNVVVVGYDGWGHRVSMEGKHLTAQLIQHEMDHLDGVTLADPR